MSEKEFVKHGDRFYMQIDRKGVEQLFTEKPQGPFLTVDVDGEWETTRTTRNNKPSRGLASVGGDLRDEWRQDHEDDRELGIWRRPLIISDSIKKESQ
jgi:hypothetical protein